MKENWDQLSWAFKKVMNFPGGSLARKKCQWEKLSDTLKVGDDKKEAYQKLLVAFEAVVASIYPND